MSVMASCSCDDIVCDTRCGTCRTADLSISSAKELLAFSEKVNGGEDFSGKTVELTADIDLGGEGSEWTPIGSSSSAFAGIFDGNNHVISGIYISSGSNAGLFRKGKRRYD